MAAKYLQKLELKWKLAYADDGLRLGLGLGRAYLDLELVCSAGKQPMMVSERLCAYLFVLFVL